MAPHIAKLPIHFDIYSTARVYVSHGTYPDRPGVLFRGSLFRFLPSAALPCPRSVNCSFTAIGRKTAGIINGWHYSEPANPRLRSRPEPANKYQPHREISARRGWYFHVTNYAHVHFTNELNKFDRLCPSLNTRLQKRSKSIHVPAMYPKDGTHTFKYPDGLGSVCKGYLSAGKRHGHGVHELPSGGQFSGPERVLRSGTANLKGDTLACTPGRRVPRHVRRRLPRGRGRVRLRAGRLLRW
jgi:hypothetical protein